MSIVSNLLLALAVSLDGLGVGIAYGLRGVKLPGESLLLIALVSLGASFFSILLGRASTLVFPPYLGQKIGAAMLIGLGCEFLLESFLKGRRCASRGSSPILWFRIPRLGLIVAILHEPTRADVDSSGSIGPAEALALGLALALDAFGVGLGAGAAGFSIVLTPFLIGCIQVLLVSVGMVAGRYWQCARWLSNGGMLPGFILIGLGIWRW